VKQPNPETNRLDPGAKFYSFYKDGPLPKPAFGGGVKGALPLRAAQFCPPLVNATQFGWYVYPPTDFALRWDGEVSDWSLLAGNEPQKWQSLAGGADAALPWADEPLADLAPELRERYTAANKGSYTFINADPRTQNNFEMALGVVVTMNPGWVMLVRSVPNWPSPRPFEPFDGIIDFDLFTQDAIVVFRLRSPGICRFYRHEPIAMLQPLLREQTAHTIFDNPTTVQGVANWPEQVFDDYLKSRDRRTSEVTMGSYRDERRRLLKGENENLNE
jgi:hypothetical protein